MAKMGQSNAKGSLEICSSQPLLVLGRIFNVASAGTFGQFLDGHVANLGLSEGETASLIGLRQQIGAFRTNISVTNGGTVDADIEVSLFDNAGAMLLAYSLAVPAGQVVQDLDAVRDPRAHGQPRLGLRHGQGRRGQQHQRLGLGDRRRAPTIR